jgi:hypothetical protein
MRRSSPTRDPMIGITITAEAYVAVKATLPADTQTWPTSPAHQGDMVICLDQAMVDRLGAMRPRRVLFRRDLAIEEMTPLEPG